MHSCPSPSIPHADVTATPTAAARVAAEQSTLCWVGGDDDWTSVLQQAVASSDLRVESYDSAEAFLAADYQGWPACLVVNVPSSGMSPRDLQVHLAFCERPIPVIFLASHLDVATVVAMMRAGAVNVLVGPVSDDVLIERVRWALEQHTAERRQRYDFTARLRQLTPQQKRVMKLMVAGLANKQIAAQLNINLKTVEIHRAHVLKRLQVRNLAELVRAVFQSTAGA